MLNSDISLSDLRHVQIPNVGRGEVILAGRMVGNQATFISEMLSKSKGRDKISAFCQYLASLYINCMKQSPQYRQLQK